MPPEGSCPVLPVLEALHIEFFLGLCCRRLLGDMPFCVITVDCRTEGAGADACGKRACVRTSRGMCAWVHRVLGGRERLETNVKGCTSSGSTVISHLDVTRHREAACIL